MNEKEAASIIVDALCIADTITWDFYSWVLTEENKEALQLAVLALEGISGSAKEIPSNSCGSEPCYDKGWRDAYAAVLNYLRLKQEEISNDDADYPSEVNTTRDNLMQRILHDVERYKFPSNSCKSGKNLQELSWQDVQRICRLEAQVSSSLAFGDADKVSDKEFYTEVLKRFNNND